jgi:hypothetical protein
MIKANDIAQGRVIQFRRHFLPAELITVLDRFTSLLVCLLSTLALQL